MLWPEHLEVELRDRRDPTDLWTLYDAPHVASLENPGTFARFAGSRSTGSASYAFVSGFLVFRAAGPEGGRVVFTAKPMELGRAVRRQLLEA